MSEKKYKILLPVLLLCFLFETAFAGLAQDSTRRGNRLYEQKKFNKAVKEYDQALIGSPASLEPKFNKANSYYRLDDLDKAINLYREVAAESKNMKLVTRAKYNLGNSSFRQGSKQRDSNLQKAVEEMKTAIGHWRGVLDIAPENQKAAKNIEVARLTIKDILDQLKNQQDPNQPQDPNQSQDPNQGQQQEQQQSEEQNQQQGQDPNQPEDPNKQQEQQKQEEQQEQQKQQEQQAADKTAQEILDKEQRDKKQRQLLQKARYRKVEKDW